jgi:hypothetical protein
MIVYTLSKRKGFLFTDATYLIQSLINQCVRSLSHYWNGVWHLWEKRNENSTYFISRVCHHGSFLPALLES